MRPWAAAITTALVLVVSSPRLGAAEEYGIGPWYVLVGQDHAVAVLNDPDQTWTLMVRCTDGHIDFVVRRVDEGVASAQPIRHYRATLEIDGKTIAQLTAQNWSAGGYLILDVGALLPKLESGLQIDFTFASGQSSTQASFLAGHTATALRPVRDRCSTGVS